MPVSNEPSSAVAEWPAGPSLVHVTLSPAVTVMELGAYLKSLIVSAPAARATARTLTGCRAARADGWVGRPPPEPPGPRARPVSPRGPAPARVRAWSRSCPQAAWRCPGRPPG